MGKPRSIEDEVADASGREDDGGKANRLGSQTLFRGLDVLEVVAEGPIGLTELAERLELTRSTTHRLAAALVDRRYLTFVPREGYSLGPKLLELGFKARDDMDIPHVARPHLERLADLADDTTHLGVLEGRRVFYLDKINGQRRVAISSRVGELQPVTSTGLGKALILDRPEEDWAEFYQAERAFHRPEATLERWLVRMRRYAELGYAFDLEENEDQIRCVAAPVRDVEGRIVAAISVSSAAQYMSDERMDELALDVLGTARAVSADLGWSGCAPAEAAAAPRRSGRRGR
jgi:DNA-binding IclR family transcriptional regulator